MNGVIYRQMTREDVDLALAGFASQGEDKPREVLETYFAEQEQGKRKMVMAARGGEIAGYVTLVPSARGGTFKREGIPEICDLIVFEKYRRRGIGTELLDRIEAEATKMCGEVCLGAGLHSGYGAAQRLYVKRGYVPDGTGAWDGQSPARQYGMVENGDSLVLYMSKMLRRREVNDLTTACSQLKALKSGGNK